MLGNAHTRAGRNKCSRRRNVECAGAIPTGTAGVHQEFARPRSVRKNGNHMPSHRARKADELANGFSFCAETREERDNRFFLGASGKDFLHRAFGFPTR